MYAGDTDAAAERNDIPAGDEASAPLDCCGGLGNVDYSKVKNDSKVLVRARP